MRKWLFLLWNSNHIFVWKRKCLSPQVRPIYVSCKFITSLRVKEISFYRYIRERTHNNNSYNEASFQLKRAFFVRKLNVSRSFFDRIWRQPTSGHWQWHRKWEIAWNEGFGRIIWLQIQVSACISCIWLCMFIPELCASFTLRNCYCQWSGNCVGLAPNLQNPDVRVGFAFTLTHFFSVGGEMFWYR